MVYFAHFCCLEREVFLAQREGEASSLLEFVVATWSDLSLMPAPSLEGRCRRWLSEGRNPSGRARKRSHSLPMIM